MSILTGVVALAPAAAGIALMSFIESISAARAFAARTDPPVDANRELLALGAVNSLEVTALDQLAGLAKDLQGRGMTLWMAVPGQQPLEVVRRAAELLGRTSLEAGTGRLGVRVFARVEDAVSAHQGS